MIIPWQDLSRSSDPALCAGGECLDGVLLQGLRDGLAAAASDSLLVLHMKGSHGPAYYKRYPPAGRRFEPTCDTNEIQHCGVDALRNTYDNGIAYTSEVLAKHDENYMPPEAAQAVGEAHARALLKKAQETVGKQ